MSCPHADKVPWKECSTCKKCDEDGICDKCRFWAIQDPPTPEDQRHKCPETIKVCGPCYQINHIIPLIWTFAFNGAEYWCPFCGNSSGCFGGESMDIPWTETLHQRMKRYKRTFGHYLAAHSALCCSQLMWDGKWVAPRELPADELKRLHVVAETGWTKETVIL